MARPKKALAKQAATKVPAKTENKFLVEIKKALITDDSWVTAVLIDADERYSNSGMMIALYTFEVVRPLVHRGRQLRFTVHEKLDKTLENLADQFPGVDFLEPMETYNTLGGQAVRLHVAVDPPRVDDAGNEYDARNRVMSVYAQQERTVKPPAGTQTVQSAETAETETPF